MGLRFLPQPACDLTYFGCLLRGPPAFFVFMGIPLMPVGLPVQQGDLIKVPCETAHPPGAVRPPENVPVLLLRQSEGRVVVRASSQRHPAILAAADLMLLDDHNIAVRLGAELAVVRDAAGDKLPSVTLAGEERLRH